MSALEELVAICGPDKADEIKRWGARWVDDLAAVVNLDPVEEFIHGDQRPEVMTRYMSELALALNRALIERQGALTPGMRRLPDGRTELRLGACLVRSEPKP